MDRGSEMRIGSLVEMYGEPGFYGIIVRKSEVVGRWYVLWQSGFIFDRSEELMEVVQ